MNSRPTRLKLALVLAVSALCGASAAFGQNAVYTQTSVTGLTFNAALPASALDDVNFSLGSTAVPQRLNGMTFGIVVPAGTAAQTAGVIIQIYNTFNAASAGSVASNLIGSFNGNLNITANTGTTAAGRTFTFSNLATALTTPIDFADDNIAVAVSLTNAAGTALSTVITPLFSNPGNPTVGTSLAGAYRDANGDGIFQATELVATSGNLYLSLTTVNIIPEPTTLAMIGLGVVTLAGVQIRRRRRG